MFPPLCCHSFPSAAASGCVPVRAGWLTGLRATWTSRWALWRELLQILRKLPSFSKRLAVWVAVVKNCNSGFLKAPETFELIYERRQLVEKCQIKAFDLHEHQRKIVHFKSASKRHGKRFLVLISSKLYCQ